jgi:hypothetical protein
METGSSIAVVYGFSPFTCDTDPKLFIDGFSCISAYPSIKQKGGGQFTMNIALAIFGSVLGLVVTGTAVYTAWMVHQLWKRQQPNHPIAEVNGEGFSGHTKDQDNDLSMESPKLKIVPHSQSTIAAQYLSRWTVWDYGVLGLFLIGIVLLAADLVAMLRDSAAYPDFHYTYLLCGIVFTVMSMLLLFARLAVVLSAGASQSSFSPQHHHEPSHTDHAK